MDVKVPKCPTFFICGKWRLGPWYDNKWKKELINRNNCEYKQYVDAKHWVHVEQCNRFNNDVQKWLNQN